MPGIAARIRAKLSRNNSAAPSLASSANSQHSIVRPDSPASNRRPPTTSSTGTGTGTADGRANGDNSQPGSGIVSSRSSSPGTGKQKTSSFPTSRQRGDGSSESRGGAVDPQPIAASQERLYDQDNDNEGKKSGELDMSKKSISTRSADDNQGEVAARAQSQGQTDAAMAPAGSETAAAAPTAASDTAGNDLHPASTSTTTSSAASAAASNRSPNPGASLLSTIREHPSDPQIPRLSHLEEPKHSTAIEAQGPRTPVKASGHPGPLDDENQLSPSPATPRPPTALHHPSASADNLLSDSPRSSSASRPGPQRRQSLVSNRESRLLRALISNIDNLDPASLPADLVGDAIPITTAMVTRKIWVRRPGGSATLVTINEEDVVDDVRDMILRKYQNSLGRQFDAPDLTIRIVPREQRVERQLGPEEPMARTLDAYFPGGQSVEEALIIDVPLRRTPRPSPRAGPPHAPQLTAYFENAQPAEHGTDYFGPAALAAATLPVTITSPSTGGSHPHSIAVLTSGQVPQLPSPGGTRTRAYRDRPDRPRLGRQHTSSPTILNLVPASQVGQVASGIIPGSAASSGSHKTDPAALPAPPTAPPLPSPPVPEATAVQRTQTPPPSGPARVSSPRPTALRPKKSKKKEDFPKLPAGSLSAMVQVPPINVLIVEDNIINLKLLEAFVKRLKVRWQTAMNGRDAVTKWRTGGFHLVLMDIQLPIMSGLEATREIRRLERVNSIGVFSSGAATAPDLREKKEPDATDKLPNIDMFKSPVIIVALTASSLQSDRHEALAAGCNDFLTKPVNFVWLERKVMEWGCMQALIDFDGWRTWKAISEQKKDGDDEPKKAATKAKKAKNRQSLTAAAA